MTNGSVNVKDWNPDWYNGAQQVAHGNFITVVVNYRLAAFGFLSMSDDVIPGNFAMLDQQRAFDWVHENIEKFGGDPNKITIHGQSAGAIMVKFHSISPMSGTMENPKFKNVIVHSGQQMAWNENPRDTAQNLARRTGCNRQFGSSSEDFLECIQGRVPIHIKNHIADPIILYGLCHVTHIIPYSPYNMSHII